MCNQMKEKTVRKKCYIYTRVSTIQQVEGFSLDAQVKRLEDYAQYRDLDIVGRYSDAGYSGHSINGRPDFLRMFNDIKTEKDDISFVLVFKLSRFGRNAADVLSSMQVLADYGIDLVSVEDSIDSSTSGGKFTLTILSAVAEIERENIAVQFAAGKRQSIKKGNWYGGPMIYGYRKEGRVSVPKDGEAEIIKKVFELYVKEDYSMFQIVKYLNEHYQERNTRNGARPFDHDFVSHVLQQTFYCGRIIYGKRSNEYLKTGNEDCLIITKGIHEPLVSEEVFDAAQEKRKIEKEKRKKKHDDEEISILAGLVKCPLCGGGLTSRFSRKRNHNHGGFYKTDRVYMCRASNVANGGTCAYRGQLNQVKIDSAVFEVITSLYKSEDFMEAVTKKFGKEEDVIKAEENVHSEEKKRNLILSRIEKLGEDLDSLEVTDEHYDQKYEKVSERIDTLYDELDEVEDELKRLGKILSAAKTNIEDINNIKSLILGFDSIMKRMTNEEKRQYCRTFIERIEVFDHKQKDGRILKKIVFKFPIQGAGDDGALISFDCVKAGLTATEAKTRGTYEQIKKYIKDKYDVKVHSMYIGQIKTKYGIDKRLNYNLSKKENAHVPKCPIEKERYIVEAMKHYMMLDESVEVVEEAVLEG